MNKMSNIRNTPFFKVHETIVIDTFNSKFSTCIYVSELKNYELLVSKLLKCVNTYLDDGVWVI